MGMLCENAALEYRYYEYKLLGQDFNSCFSFL